MNAKRTFFLMIGLLVLLTFGVFGGVFGINELLSSQSDHLVTLKAQLAGLNNEVSSLAVAKKDIATYSSLDNIASVMVPENKDQAETVRQIVNLAAANGVSLDSITFPSSTLGGAAITTPGAPTEPTTSSTNNLSQLVAVPNIAGVYELQITVASATETNELATYPQLIGFLTALENNRQTALVNSIDIEPNPQDNNLFSFLLTIEIYIKPGS